MTQEELEAEVLALKNKVRDSTRPWRHARWESIKADPQAAATMLAVGVVAGHFFGGAVLKFIGF